MKTSAAGIEELARATPPSRDRSIDFLRAASIVAVVFGHWFIGMIHWRDGLIWTTSAVGVTSYLWVTTWVFQVMPVFFFVGGFSNLVSFESAQAHGRGTGKWIRDRLERLLKPSAVFLGGLADRSGRWPDARRRCAGRAAVSTWSSSSSHRRRSRSTGDSACGSRSRWRSARSERM